MFSQRNYPYCELLQNYKSNVLIFFNFQLRFSVRFLILLYLYLASNMNIKKKSSYNEENIRIGFRDNLNRMVVYK
jgi:hypothetical protein